MPPIAEWQPAEPTTWVSDADCVTVRFHGSSWREARAYTEGWNWHRPVQRSRTRRDRVRLEVTFENLAHQWEMETAFESVVTRKAMHPAYQRIIGMGPDAVPLILARLRREPKQWFWALTAITGENPAEGAEAPQEAAQAWLEWGEQRGLLD